MTDLSVALALKYRDEASGGLRRTTSQIERDLDRIRRTTEGANRALGDTDRNLGRINRTTTGVNQTTRAWADYQSRIRRETATTADLLRVLELRARANVGHFRQMATYLERVKLAAVAVGKVGMVAGAGVGAAAISAAPKVQSTMDYDQRLAALSLTLFQSKSVSAKIASRPVIEELVKQTNRKYGGTRDSITSIIETLASSNVTDAKGVFTMTPGIQKYATAGNADSGDVARLAASAVKAGFTPEQAGGQLLDMALRSGQLGGFELKDMAKHLPESMSLMGGAGMTGLSGFAKLVSLYQASLSTAGSTDQGAVNVKNLLGKLASRDTANDAKKLGIDWDGTLLKSRAKGMDSLDTALAIIDRELGKDQRFTKLTEQMKTAKPGEKKDILDAQMGILEGSVIGKLFQDMEAKLGLLAARNQRESLRTQTGTVLASDGTAGNDAFTVMSSTNAYKVNQAQQEWLFATQEGFKGLDDIVGKVSDRLTKYAQENEKLAGDATVTATALTGVAAAAGAATMAFGPLAGLVVGGVGLLNAPMLPGSIRGVNNRLSPDPTGALKAMDAGKDKPQKLELDVGFKNGNLTAEMRDAAKKEARRH